MVTVLIESSFGFSNFYTQMYLAVPADKETQVLVHDRQEHAANIVKLVCSVNP